MILFLCTTHSLCLKDYLSFFLYFCLKIFHSISPSLFVCRFYTLSLSLFVHGTFSLVKLHTVIPFAFNSLAISSQISFSSTSPRLLLQPLLCPLPSLSLFLSLCLMLSFSSPYRFFRSPCHPFLHLFPYHLTLLGLSTFLILFFPSISSPFFYTSKKCTFLLHLESLYISVLFSQLNYLSSSFLVSSFLTHNLPLLYLNLLSLLL